MMTLTDCILDELINKNIIKSQNVCDSILSNELYKPLRFMRYVEQCYWDYQDNYLTQAEIEIQGQQSQQLHLNFKDFTRLIFHRLLTKNYMTDSLFKQTYESLLTTTVVVTENNNNSYPKLETQQIDNNSNSNNGGNGEKNDKIKELCASYRKHTNALPVCGCIILSKDKRRVVVVQSYGRNIWNFPRGKKMMEETDEECAIRETFEETGLDVSKFIKSELFLEVYEKVRIRPLSLTSTSETIPIEFNPSSSSSTALTTAEVVNDNEVLNLEIQPPPTISTFSTDVNVNINITPPESPSPSLSPFNSPPFSPIPIEQGYRNRFRYEDVLKKTKLFIVELPLSVPFSLALSDSVSDFKIQTNKEIQQVKWMFLREIPFKRDGINDSNRHLWPLTKFERLLRDWIKSKSVSGSKSKFSFSYNSRHKKSQSLLSYSKLNQIKDEQQNKRLSSTSNNFNFSNFHCFNKNYYDP
jgi:8-oxo-dGTP pyrophosphatase MutT (NUDIX family)